MVVPVNVLLAQALAGFGCAVWGSGGLFAARVSYSPLEDVLAAHSSTCRVWVQGIALCPC